MADITSHLLCQRLSAFRAESGQFSSGKRIAAAVRTFAVFASVYNTSDHNQKSGTPGDPEKMAMLKQNSGQHHHNTDKHQVLEDAVMIMK
ncbi:MAG: hypothetical protein IKU68_04015 [Oscillospiraceae bacterium]|nr:hypothetical protein [Oscillospiraceae bacterium]